MPPNPHLPLPWTRMLVVVCFFTLCPLFCGGVLSLHSRRDNHSSSHGLSPRIHSPALMLEYFMKDVPDADKIEAIPGHGSAGMIAIVTISCDTVRFARATHPTRLDFCTVLQKWGYTLIMDTREPTVNTTMTSLSYMSRSTAFHQFFLSRASAKKRKLELVSLLLDKGYQTVVWKDADVIIMDCDISLESIFKQCPNKDSIFFSDGRGSSRFICAGTFIVRNTAFSRNLLKRAIENHLSVDKSSDSKSINRALLGNPRKLVFDRNISRTCPSEQCMALFPKETQKHLCLLQDNAFGTIHHGIYTEGQIAQHVTHATKERTKKLEHLSALSTCGVPYSEGKKLHIYSVVPASKMEHFCQTTALTHAACFPFGIPISVLSVQDPLEALAAVHDEMARGHNESREADESLSNGDVYLILSPSVWFQADAAEFLKTYRSAFPSDAVVLPHSGKHLSETADKTASLASQIFPLVVPTTRMQAFRSLIENVKAGTLNATLEQDVHVDYSNKLSRSSDVASFVATSPPLLVHSLYAPPPTTELEWNAEKFTRFVYVNNSSKWEKRRYGDICFERRN
mmetsp:Transcript_50413/g.126312  ORF Transcript_50413/g.126312 Transcript_50413/m.126312 type:complete len:569 (-) Transcript_50413:1180-2886(-)